MSTLLVTDVFPPTIGGSGRWLWEVYRRLPQREVLIAAGVGPRQEEFDRTHDLRVVRLPMTIRPPGLMRPTSLAKYGRALRALRKLVETEQIESVHCGCCLPEGVMAPALKVTHGIPYVCYAHGEEFGFARTSRELTWLAQRVLRGATAMIANSRTTERLLKEQWGLPAERVRVLYPGVDTGRFRPAPRDRATRERLGWGDRPVVLTVGRLQKAKGHDRMIPAVGTLRESIPDILYAVAGDGQERQALEGLVAELGLGDHVQFLGAPDEDDLVRCYQQCDLFVLPNRRVGSDVEGFGIVLLEAQACGKAVVAGAAGGTTETMRTPETGLVVSCESPGEIADVVLGLLSDPTRRAAMGMAGRDWVVERFDWSVLSRQAETLLRVGKLAR